MKKNWTKIAIGSALTLAVAVGGFFGYFQLVRAGVLRYNKYDRREKGTLVVGSAAPNLTLTTYDGAPLRLAELWATKPVFLVFGRTFAERKALAKVLVEKLEYRMPVAIDSIDNQADQVFAAWPERIYILGAEGRVLYKGDMGPFGFHPEAAEKALLALPPPAPNANTGG